MSTNSSCVEEAVTNKRPLLAPGQTVVFDKGSIHECEVKIVHADVFVTYICDAQGNEWVTQTDRLSFI